MYNTLPPANTFIVNPLPHLHPPPIYTQAPVQTLLPPFPPPFLPIPLFFFPFTTIIPYYYIPQTNIPYLTSHTHARLP
ncbi:alanine:cation symporter family protein, partial [Siminovitchia fortis]|uniref:alanine:cation symporter family protein n=1 Tax=Siminovitchia fortis TaxID=254758 RepID=UPI0036F3D290